MAKRSPFLVARDKAYDAAKPHPRLTADGSLKMDPMPLAIDLIGLRPLTIEEQVARFTRADITDFNLIPDENFLDEEDFHDYLDDLPEEGLSPYELAGFQNISRQYEYGRTHMAPADFTEDDSDLPAPPLPEPTPSAPKTHGKAKAPSSGTEE